MTQILFPSGAEMPLNFYLAAEEFVAGMDCAGEKLFFWSVAPTVIFGRNQVMSDEVNLIWCMEHGVQVFRRKSGGGCVYADHGNLMISYISPGISAEEAFGRYMELMTSSLAALGLDAVASVRNDIMVGDSKVSGNAFYSLHGSGIVHGTLLYDVDIDSMSCAITPSAEKLRSKGVASVRQRVANIRPLLGVTAAHEGVSDMESLSAWLADRLCDRSILLTDDNMQEISGLSEKYLDRAFLLGKENEK